MSSSPRIQPILAPEAAAAAVRGTSRNMSPTPMTKRNKTMVRLFPPPYRFTPPFVQNAEKPTYPAEPPAHR